MIYWKVPTANARLASIRIRGWLPFCHLARRGYACKLLLPKSPVPRFSRADMVIFVKAFSNEDVEIARSAHASGASVILDICDNVFVPNYSSLGARPEAFVAMAELASAIVTTGPALESVVRGKLGTYANLVVIPDGLEVAQDIQELKRLLFFPTLYEALSVLTRRSFLRIHEEGIRALPFFCRKLGEKIIFVTRYFTENIRWKLFVRGIDKTPRTKKEGTTGANKQLPRVLWFGNSGAPYARFGISDIGDIGPALVEAAARRPFILTVVSNSREAYEKYVEPLALRTEYHEWNPGFIERILDASSVAIIPNSGDAFSICKSANRAVLAFSKGVPVVATSTPAMEAFRGTCFFDDWARGIQTYLDYPEVVKTHVSAARQVIADQFVPEAIANSWETLLKGISAKNLASR